MKEALETALEKMDVWLMMFTAIVALGVGGEAVFGVRHWLLSRRLRAVSHSEDVQRQTEIARLKKEAEDAHKSAGDAFERAGKAEKHAAEANRTAAQANLKQESLKRENLDLQHKLLELKQRVEWRDITPEQALKIKDRVAPMRGQRVDFNALTSDPEAINFSQLLAASLVGGMDVSASQDVWLGSAPPRPAAGIVIVFGINRNEAARVIADAFEAAGVVPSRVPRESSTSPDDIVIWVRASRVRIPDKNYFLGRQTGPLPYWRST